MFETNIPLKQLSHYKIGGKSKYFFEAKNIDGLIKAIEKQRRLKTPLFILAGATNVLINDDGFNGLIIKPNFQFIKKEKEFLVKAGAGVSMAQLLNDLMARGLSGLEWAGGLPGTFGGAIRGNAGAFGKETKDIIEEVISLDISQKIPKIVKRKKQNCDFEYRSSFFKKNPQKEIIIEATLKLQKGDKKAIEEETAQNINYRLSKHPMDYPSLGSTFKNLPAIPAAFLISEAGLKGVSCGGAMISPKHPNFIVNVLNATASDVKNLIKLTKKEVKRKFNIDLKEEIEYLKN